jgi:hypothetical protein
MKELMPREPAVVKPGSRRGLHQKNQYETNELIGEGQWIERSGNANPGGLDIQDEDN